MIKKYSPDWWASLPPERIGKETEKLLTTLFTEMNSKQDFAFSRLPDATSARGALAAQPGDYVYRHGQFSGFVELKALKHLTRLPAARLTQLPTLKKWALAGSQSVVLVFHWVSGQWRVLLPENLDAGATSWDLSGFPAYGSAGEALRSTGYF